MSDGDTSTGGKGQTFTPEQQNGVYLLGVKSVFDGYLVDGKGDKTHVRNITVNGRYIGTSDYFETECDYFKLTPDGTLDLRYLDKDNDPSDK